MRRILFAALAACAQVALAADPAGENATEARPVVVRATQRGGLAFPSGGIDFSAARPGWDPYPLKADWDQASADGSRQFEIRDDRGEALFRGRSVWSRRPDGSVAGRVEIECVRAVEMQCLALNANVPAEPSFGLGDGTAADFDLPLSDGRAIRVSFPRPVAYHSQDSRPWFGQWTVRFGGHLGHGGTRAFAPGERLVWDVAVSAPEGIALDLARPLDVAEGADWARLDYFKDIEPGSALDFSGMGLQVAPAGKHGRLKAVGGHFEFEGLPGVEQRFYGVNLCFTANYPDHDVADRLVDRLVRCGYNALRIHHHDGIWAADYLTRRRGGAEKEITNADLCVPASLREEANPVNPANPVILSNNTSAFSAPPREDDSIDRLDYLLARCFERGIYATTDLYVSRPVAWREIGIDRDGEMPKALYKTYVGCHDGAFSNWCHWARSFLEHANPYTGRAYKDEPGLPLVALVNEGRLAEGWAAAGKAHDPVVMEAWREFLAAGGSGGGAPPVCGGPGAEPPQDGPLHDAFDDWLNRRIWERCTAFLRSIGCRALLTNDSSGRRHGEGEGTTPLMDYVDCHSYVDHPVFLEQPWRLPFRLGNANPVKDGKPAVFHRGWAKDASKPYALTEWNFSGPGRYRGMGGMLAAALAAEQGWDGLWRFAYSHDRSNLVDGGRGGSLNFDLAEDPLMAASDRAGVLLFLRGDATQENDELRMTNDEFATPAPLREGGGGKAAGGSTPRGALRLDSAHGSFSVVTPRTCGGFAESGRIDAGPISFEIIPGGSGAEPPSVVPATLWASSLDGEPLERSSRILVTHLTDVQGDGARYADDSRTILLKWGRSPLVEAGAAEVGLRLSANDKCPQMTSGTNANGNGTCDLRFADNGDLKFVGNPFAVYALDTAGRRAGDVPSRVEGGVLRFAVSARQPFGGCLHYEIVREPAGAAAPAADRPERTPTE